MSNAKTLSDEERAFLAQLGIDTIDDETIWIEALTHGSTGAPRDYQRLEFLGDRVLGLSIAETLYRGSNHAEGKLAQRLNALVSKGACADVGRSIGLSEVVRLGSQAREDGGAESENILGDVVESLLGAHFLSFGFDSSRDLVLRLWADALDGGVGRAKHPKSALQEWAASNQRKPPEYKLLSREGPDHSARFTVEVSVKNVGETRATANSKQEAEKLAAEKFMEQFA